MTLLIKVGRRTPKNWFKRQANRVGGLISFQENLWIMINQSFGLGMKKCNASGKGTWVQVKKRENESLHYDIEWLEITIQGNEAFEKEEYEEALNLYKPFGKIFKKELPRDKNLSQYFKTKILSPIQVDEAYKKGYGAMEDNNVANKLLEMGILTHIELIDDYKTRDVEIKPDF